MVLFIAFLSALAVWSSSDATWDAGLAGTFMSPPRQPGAGRKRVNGGTPIQVMGNRQPAQDNPVDHDGSTNSRSAGAETNKTDSPPVGGSEETPIKSNSVGSEETQVEPKSVSERLKEAMPLIVVACVVLLVGIMLICSSFGQALSLRKRPSSICIVDGDTDTSVSSGDSSPLPSGHPKLLEVPL